MDDGNGSSSGNNAGFDLDAVEALQQPPVVYILIDCYVDDSQGNNDQRLDPGESAEIVFTLSNNGGLTAENAIANLNYDSAWITVEVPDIEFGTIAHGESAQAAVQVTVDPAAPLEAVVMTVLNVTANNGGYTESFPVSFTLGAMIEDWETNGFGKFPWAASGRGRAWGR